MLSEINQFVKNHFSDIILLIVVILITLLSFACGFLLAKYQEKEPIRIVEKDRNSNLYNYFIRSK